MYGFCLLLGMSLTALLGERLCKRRDLDVQIFWRAVFYGLLFGLLGARLYHVVHRLDYFMTHPLEMVAVWRGGLGIWGGIFGGLLGIFVSTRKTKKLLAYTDVFAVCAPLAQAAGRWGNYFNHEIFGYPTNLPWGIYVPWQLRPERFKYYDHFHPLFLYESVFDLLLFVFLYKIYRRQKVVEVKPSAGVVTMLYLAGYSLIRFLLEFMRPDPWSLFGVPVASVISVVVLMILFAVWKNRVWGKIIVD